MARCPQGSGASCARGGVMVWLLMNIPLAAACFAAWFGIPLWMVLRHPNWGPEHHDSPPADAQPGRGPCWPGSTGRRSCPTWRPLPSALVATDQGPMRQQWDAAVAAASEGPPATLPPQSEELVALWDELARALRRVPGRSWPTECDGLVLRIVVLSRLTAATPWPWVPASLLTSGVYQGVLASAGIAFTPPDTAGIDSLRPTMRRCWAALGRGGTGPGTGRAPVLAVSVAAYGHPHLAFGTDDDAAAHGDGDGAQHAGEAERAG